MATAGHAAGLIDTDVLIDAARGVSDAINFIADQHAAGGVRLSVVSAMELTIGCRNANELVVVRSFLQNAMVAPLTATASIAAWRLVETYWLSHGLRAPDALIAATALELGLPLYSKNTRHFQMIPSLAIVRPY